VTLRKQLVLMLCFALLQSCSTASAQRQLSAQVNKLGVGVIAAELVVSKPYSNIGPRAMWWGTDLTEPNEVVTDLRITVAGEEIVIPFSAFSDLAEPRAVRIIETTMGFSLDIDGSNSAGAYRATLEFVGNRIARRHVASRAFPNERWDEFVYSFVPDDGR